MGPWQPLENPLTLMIADIVLNPLLTGVKLGIDPVPPTSTPIEGKVLVQVINDPGKLELKVISGDITP